MKSTNPKKKFWLGRVVFATLFLAIAGSASVLMGWVLAQIESRPPIEELEYYAPPESTFMFDHDQRQTLAEFFNQRRYVLTYRQFPKQLAQAFMAIEDRRFYRHVGVDPISVARAVAVNVRAREFEQGFSTISMQLPGSILSEVDRRQRTVDRKIRESIIAMQIERRYTKEQILEFYLNQIYLGEGAYGVEAAASTYFGETVQELTLAECALLAGLPQLPSAINPVASMPRALKRREQVLRAMLDCGFISLEDFQKANDEPIRLNRGGRSVSIYRAPYFVNHARDSLLRQPDFRELAVEAGLGARVFLETGGFKIISTLDLQLQRIAEETMDEGLLRAERLWHEAKYARLVNDENEYFEPRAGEARVGRITGLDDEFIKVEVRGYTGMLRRPDPLPFHTPQTIVVENQEIPNPNRLIQQGELVEARIDSVDSSRRTFEGILLPETKLRGAMVALDATSGRVLAMVGGDDYYNREDPQAQFNYAALGGRQPGSGVKPLFYAAAIANGFAPNQMFLNEPFAIGEYTGKNYSKLYQGRMMTLQEGLERSQNVMMLRVFSELGNRIGVDFARQFDFSRDEPSWDLPYGQASLCLGSFDATPLEMAAAYLPLANEGVAIRPYSIERIETGKGDTVFETRPERRVILSPQEAFIVASMMRGVVGPRGTASEIGDFFRDREGMPRVAGKTGTTNEVRDAWFNGFTPDLVVSVVVGFDPPRPLGWKLTGGKLSAPIFRDFLDRALETRDDWTREFRQPPGLIKRIVNLRTGLPVTEWNRTGDPTMEAEMWFPAGQAP